MLTPHPEGMSRYHRASAALPAPERWFHGTSAPEFSRFRPGEAYLTDDPAEAMGFAAGGHLGGSTGGEARVLETRLAPGAVADAADEIDQIVMEEHPELDDIDGLMARLRGEGYRYADFTHPGFAGGDIRVRVSLHPEEDLLIAPPARGASAAVPARTGKGLEVLVEAEERGGSGTVRVTDPATGQQVGSLDFAHVSDEWHRVGEVEVDEAYRRQGIAMLMYDWVEMRMGKGLVPSDTQSDEAVAFWTDRIGPYDPLDDEDEHGGFEAEASLRDDLERSLGARGVRGDDLLDALDLADEMAAAGAEVSPDGIVTLYHRTDAASAEEIARTGRMLSREDRVFFGTSPTGQIEGHGAAAVRVRMPLERLELQALMPDEAFVTVMSRGRPVQVDAEVVTASRTAWSRDTLDTGSMCRDRGSDIDIAGRIEDGDDLVCRACHRRRQAPPEESAPKGRKGRKWWWNASAGAATNSFERGWRANRDEGRAWRGSSGEHASGWPGLFLSFDESAAAQYGPTAEYRLSPQTTLDIDAPEASALVDGFYAANPDEDMNDGDPDDLFLFPPDAWVAFLKGMGWTSTSIGPDIFLFNPSDAVRRTASARAAARASELIGLDDAEASAMARDAVSAEGMAARRAAAGVEAEIEAIAADTRRRLGVDHELEDGEAPKALCLDFARGLADELVRRGYSAGVTQGLFEVDWPDEEAYEDWDPEDFGSGEDDELADEDETSGQDAMGQAMHFPLHYWVRVTAKNGEPIGPVFADITADQFDDECKGSFDLVWVWTGETERHQSQRHDFGGAASPRASRYHCARLVIADDPEYVYHGTSLAQLEAIRDTGWQANNLYLADCREKSDDYAERQANADDACPVVLQLDMAALRRTGRVEADSGSGPEEWEQDMGQFTYSGPLRDAITNLDEVIRELRDEWGEGFAP